MKRINYSQEYKEETVALVLKSGRPCSQIAKELGIKESTLYSWVSQLKPSTPPPTQTTQDLEKENIRLRKELAILKEEREILKKATAFFAKQ